MHLRLLFAGMSALAVLLAAVAPARAGVDAALYGKTVNQGIEFLRSAQAEDGSFSKETGVGVTALCVAAVLKQGRSAEDPLVAKGLKFLESYVQEDGGVYKQGSSHRNYETSLSILAFSEANQSGEYDKLIKRADGFLKGIQWDEEEGKDKSDPAWGGAGYGSHKRPDLSNTSFLIEALIAAGNGPEDEALQRALVFVSRAQNLESEHNTLPHAAKNPDGGFYYTPANGGESQAGKTANGGLRSYASMTYAGLKSMIYAGVDKDDQRVKAAVEWIRKHYDLDSNPGMGAAGLYYYYHTFAKALDALGVDTFVDASGQEHDWRSDLLKELASRQQENGSWINEENGRWLEQNPELVTGYALLALAHCQK